LSAIEGAWWLSRDEMEHLEMHNERFREISWIEEVMDEKFDWQSDRSTWVPRTVTQVARDCGLLTHGSNELRGRATAELRAALAKHPGEPTASRYSINGIQGRYWTVPPIHQFKVH
ncbi:MAG: hypothetical protein GY943_01070, partial [Chloroflexi bacterium]|nr:hypothetical protein [Chloroflexota bacterium]